MCNWDSFLIFQVVKLCRMKVESAEKRTFFCGTDVNLLWATSINSTSLSTFRVHENKNSLSKNISTHYVPACHIVSSTPCLIHPLFSSTTWFFSAFCAHISTCLGASFKIALVFCKKERSWGTVDWPSMLCTLKSMSFYPDSLETHFIQFFSDFILILSG